MMFFPLLGLLSVAHGFPLTPPSLHKSTRLASTSVEPSVLRNVRFLIHESQQPDLLCDFLMEIGACSTSITDADRGTDQERPLFGEPSMGFDPWRDSVEWVAPVWRRCVIDAHFPASIDVEAVGELIQTTFEDDCPGLVFQVDSVPDKDWIDEVQKSWNPIVTGRYLLAFPWHDGKDLAEAAAQADSSLNNLVTIRLQGGIAFGTGEHPTTQVCLEWLDSVMDLAMVKNDGDITVLDYGTGSGVLGIAACTKDVDRVSAIGIDIDFDACCIANANAERNKVAMSNYLPPIDSAKDDESRSLLLKAHHHARGRLAERNDSGQHVFLPEHQLTAKYDIIVANILAAPLVALATTLADMAKEGAPLGLSGILAPQGDWVVQAYTAAGFEDVKVERELEGWVLVTGRMGARNRKK